MALTTIIKRKFAAENGVTFRDLAKHPSLFRKISSCRVPESGSHPLAGRGYPFFGKTIDTKDKSQKCLMILRKW